MHSHHLGGGMQFHKTDYLLYCFIAKPFWCFGANTYNHISLNVSRISMMYNYDILLIF